MKRVFLLSSSERDCFLWERIFCEGPPFVASDRSQNHEFTFSTRFVLDSPASRRQHAEANRISATMP